MQNILDTYQKKFGTFWSKLSKPKRVALSVGISIGTVVLLLTVWAVINIRAIQVVYAESLAGKQSFEYAQVAVGAQNFGLAKNDLLEAKEHFEKAHSTFNRFSVYKIVPGIARQIRAIDNVLQAGVNLSTGMYTLAELGENVMGVLSNGDDELSFSDITTEDKANILKALNESTADLHGVNSEIALAVLLIEEIPDTGLFTKVSEAVAPIKQELPLLESIIDQVIPAAESLPSILGYPNEKTYLFLLQNNRELRPTGGFLGTYGVLRLANAEITQFETDNIYNLDDPVKDIITEPSPGPIAQHTTTQNWLMRNANWSPDFPTSARKAESKYHEEGGPIEEFDGVIAITPTFIESLLTMTGPLTVDGLEFSDENLFTTLEHQVRSGFQDQGLDVTERKEIIGSLGTRLLDEMLGMPRSELPKLWETFMDNVKQKHILIYVDDPITQSLVIEQNWAGEMKPYTSDYLMFVDANLAALKTDNVLKRTLSYSVYEDSGTYYGVADMLYTHTYPRIDGSHTRYRTYTRVYLPKGAELKEHFGFLTGDKIQNGVPADPEIYEESFTHSDGTLVEYTVVAGFTAIEPGEERHITLKYILPESVVKTIKDKTYTAYIQKQAGTIDHQLHFSFDIGKHINTATPLDYPFQIVDNNVSLDMDLTEDREIDIQLK